MKKRPLIFIAIGVAALLVLGGGGFFAYKMFSSKKAGAPAEGKQEEKSKEEKHGEETKGHEKEGAKGGEHGAKGEGGHGAVTAPGMGPTVALEPFVVNLADPGRSRYAKIVAQLELDSEQTAGLIDGVKPKVRDALIMLFSSKTAEEMVTVGGKEVLRNEIIRRVNGLLTSGKVSEVYFTEFVVQ